jgi:non-homologous end joining protein Ku
MHSMWKGAISFGLVMIPVKLYSATEQKDIAFRQVHRAPGEPVSLADALRASIAAAHEEREQAGPRRARGTAAQEPPPGADGAGRAHARRRSRRRASA